MASSTLYLGNVAQVNGSNMTIIAGKKLNITDTPTSDLNAANKAYVDAKAKEVQDALNLVTAGADVSFDTLLELKNLSDSLHATGASDLTTAISNESQSRIDADISLETRLSTEENTRTDAVVSIDSRVSTEEVARIDAVVSIDARVSTEENARIDAVVSIDARVSTEEVNRSDADARLETIAIKSSTTMLYVPTVYADSSTLPIPLEQCNYTAGTNAANFDGWRMRNSVAGKKFNFYVPSTGLKVGDVKAMYLETCTPSVVSMPFLTLYTVKKNTPGEQSWYRSRASYIRNDTDVLVAGSKYNMVANLKDISNVYSSTYFTQHNMILDTYSSRSLDIMTDDDDVMFFAISSDSSSAVGNVECIISKFKVQLTSGIHEFVFSNQHVFIDYMKRKTSQLWNSLYGTSSSDDPFMLDYQIPTPERFTA